MAIENTIAEALNRLISFLSTVGLRSFYFPLLLIFAVLFGLLDKVNVFDNKKISAVIALMAGFLIMTSPFGTQIAIFFEGMFSRTSVVLIGFLVFAMIVGLLYGPPKDLLNTTWILVGAVLIGLYIFWISGGFSLIDRYPIGPLGIVSGDVIFLLVLVGFVALILWMTGLIGKKNTHGSSETKNKKNE